MDTSMNGKEILAIEFMEGHDRPKTVIQACSTEKRRLYLSASYHGDHDEFWVVEETLDGDGNMREVSRYNPRAIEAIHWAA